MTMSTNADYQITERQATETTIQVSVPADGVSQQIDAVYREYAKEVRVPGFRKGRVPRSFLDSRFGRDVFLQEAQDELQRKYLPLALDSLDLRPVSRPEMDVVSFGESEPFVFRATFATLPEVALPETVGLEIEIPALKEVSEDDVHGALEDVQNQFGVLGELEGESVSEGDLVRVKEGEQEWDTRAMGENPVTQHLVGADVGSTVEIDTELPDGKAFKTTLEVVGLRQIILPEIDDDLAKDAGYDDLDALTTDIRERLERRRNDVHRQLVQSALLDALLAKTEIPLPAAFVDELVDDEVTRLRESLSRSESGQTFEAYLEGREQTEDEFRSELRDSVEGRVRRELILHRLAEAFELSIDDEELTSLAEGEAEDFGEDPMRFVARLKAEDRWESYRQSKVNERIFEALRESATIKEKEA